MALRGARRALAMGVIGGAAGGDTYADLLIGLGALQILPLDDASGNPQDVSGNNRDGVFSGAPDYQYAAAPAGIGGLSVHLPSGSYCNAGNAGIDPNNAVYSFWYKADSDAIWTDGSWRCFFTISGSGGLYGLYKAQWANEFYFYSNTSNGIVDRVFVKPAGVTDGWNHYAFRFDASTGAFALFIDGAQVGTTGTGIGTVSSVGPDYPRFAQNDNGSQPLPGLYSYWSVFPVLTDGEIGDLVV